MNRPTAISATLAIGFGLLLATPAFAAKPIVTPPLDLGSASYGVNSYACTALNVNKKEIPNVTIEIVGSDGAVFASSPAVTLIPGDDRTWFAVDPVNGGAGAVASRAYCRVTGKVSAKRVYVTFCTFAAGDTECAAMVTP